MKDLADGSTHIVTGKIIDIDHTEERNSLVITYYNFKVDQSLKGDLKSGDMIIITQGGGETPTEIVAVEDDPLIKVGEEFVGFLIYSPDLDVYPIAGGPQGRFLIQNNLVNSLDTVDEKTAWIPVKVHSKNLDQFIQEISEQSEKSIRSLSASWDNYPTLKDLTRSSTHIVIGEITGIQGVNDKDTIPTTDYSFRVDRSLKGDLKPNDVITIRQTGMETDTTLARVLGDPLLKKGETFLGFLRYSTDTGVYPIVGGPQGRYPVQNGLVNSLDRVDPEAFYVPIRFENKPLDEVVRELQAAEIT